MRYKLRKLKQKYVHKASKNSSIAGVINNEIFLNIIEKELISFTGIKFIDKILIRNLSYEEFKEIRKEVKEILIKNGIWIEIEHEKEKPKFDKEEIQQFKQMQNTVYEKIKSGTYFKNGRSRN